MNTVKINLMLINDAGEVETVLTNDIPINSNQPSVPPPPLSVKHKGIQYLLKRQLLPDVFVYQPARKIHVNDIFPEIVS